MLVERINFLINNKEVVKETSEEIYVEEGFDDGYSTIYQDDRAVSAKWLKACLDAKKLVSRTSMILYRPFPRLLKDHILCLTGFGSDDRLKMESYIVYETD